MSGRFEDRVVISGIGQSQVGRRLYRSALDLTLDACLAAIADAGLTREQIDGLSSYPGAMASPPGFSGPGTPEVQDALRLSLSWHHGGPEGPAQLSAVTSAALAVAAGLARHVLVYRTVTEASAQGDRGRAAVVPGGGAGGAGGGAGRVSGFLQWTLPFAAYSAVNWIALYAARHFHEYGTTSEQLGQIAVNNRRNAGHNPHAVYRDPLTLEDYLSSRMISSPLRLYDCDAPCDGSVAVVVSAADHEPDAPHPVARIGAVGTALRGRPSWDQFDDLTTFACRDAASHLWSRTDLRPGDVDVAQLYDGFSFLTLAWLEALGFCPKGDGGPFLEGGSRIALDGAVPLNTSGGQLSAGRLHGFGLLHEAVVQLRGDGAGRQVHRAGGRLPEVALVAAGGGPLAGALLLTR